MVDRVDMPVDEPGMHRAVDEADRAVVMEQQRIGRIADRGSVAVWMAADREQQLMLRGRDADGRRLLLAPPEELTQSGSQIEQTSVVVVVGFVIVGHGGSLPFTIGKLGVRQYIVTR
jgi:hypothetical protein